MRVMDCDCGKTIQAANDDDLLKEARRHADEVHADLQLTDEQLQAMIDERAYEAADA